MPNWCRNKLVIRSTAEDVNILKQFMNDAQVDSLDSSTPFSMKKLLPPPDNIKDKDFWRNKNWGTKWDADVYSGWNDESGDLKYPAYSVLFCTAWSPPISFLYKISKKYPSIEFELGYIETGMERCGKVEIINRVCIEEYEPDWGSPAQKQLEAQMVGDSNEKKIIPLNVLQAPTPEVRPTPLPEILPTPFSYKRDGD